ncbi:MAG: hypothetical protein E7580_01440 [Ruminococcaceae bacterium]|nr:hypothetical protein [Oscillospiraceae bacterium]
MKKILALILALVTVFSLCACSSDPLESTAPAENTKTAEQKKTESAEPVRKAEKFKVPDDLPEGFAVGYSIIDISTVPLPMYDATAQTIHDPLMLTCTAISDGENVALIMSADLKGMKRNVAESSMKIIENRFGIPGKNVMFNCTHTHSAPTVGGNSAELARWETKYYKQLPILVSEALHDLDPVENAYIGKGIAEGISFVRRYHLADGGFRTNASASKNPVAHESVADPELRTIRFDRKNKKDVLMVNYQTHYGGATGLYPEQLSADFILPFREQAEKKYDCLFTYQSGAGGNINFNSSIPGEDPYPTFLDAIPAFMEATDEALAAEELAQLGTIRSAESIYTATVRKDSPERVQQALECQAAGWESELGISLMQKYNFETKYDASHTISRNREKGDTEDVNFSAIAFGDIAFTAFPYEMFDTNGKEVRDGSPYKMTFICSLTNGSMGYMPSALAFTNGSYEVLSCPYVAGCGEEFAQEMLRLLNVCKNQA